MVYTWAITRVANAGEEALAEFESDLAELLPWQDDQSEAGAEIESNSFMAMMNNQG